MVKIKKDRGAEEVILLAARKIFIQKGMAGARMQDIADAAGINKALLHYYFRNKEKLFQTVFMESVQDFLPRINAVIESDAPLFKKIEIFCAEYISKLIENPFIPLFVINEVSKQPEAFIKKTWGRKKPKIGKLAEQIETAAKQGLIKEIHPLHLIMNMTSMCIFPFLAKPMLQNLAGVNDRLFFALMEQRKTEVAKFIIDSIKKRNK